MGWAVSVCAEAALVSSSQADTDSLTRPERCLYRCLDEAATFAGSFTIQRALAGGRVPSLSLTSIRPRLAPPPLSYLHLSWTTWPLSPPSTDSPSPAGLMSIDPACSSSRFLDPRPLLSRPGTANVELTFVLARHAHPLVAHPPRIRQLKLRIKQRNTTRLHVHQILKVKHEPGAVGRRREERPLARARA